MQGFFPKNTTEGYRFYEVIHDAGAIAMFFLPARPASELRMPAEGMRLKYSKPMTGRRGGR